MRTLHVVGALVVFAACSRQSSHGISRAADPLLLPAATLGDPRAGIVTSDAWPAARSGHAMVYHDRLRMVVMYGGTADSILWGWDGNRWTSLGIGPGLRNHVAVAYDIARDRLVLYGGGLSTSRHGDTWEWDQTGWHLIAPTEGPGIRDAHAMAYDATRKRVIMFGGVDSAVAIRHDTWEWDGRRWRLVTESGPSGRALAGMTFDSQLGGVVLTGGLSAERPRHPLRDTWAFNGSAWRLVTDSGPARWGPVVRDPRNGELLRIAGQGDTTIYGDVWSLTGTTWHALPEALLARQSHAAALDPRRKRVVVFGGSHAGGVDVLGDTWEWDGRTWRSFVPRAR